MKRYVDLDRHKQILGILFVVFSSLNLVLLLVATTILSIVLPQHLYDSEALLAYDIIKYVVWTLAVFLTLPSLIAGIGLIYKKEWALIMAFIISIIGLLGFPIWTFISIYTIIVFIIAQSNNDGNAKRWDEYKRE